MKKVGVIQHNLFIIGFCRCVDIHAFFGAFRQTFVVVIKHALTALWGWDWGGGGIQSWRWMGDVTEWVLAAGLKRIWGGVELTTYWFKQNGSINGHLISPTPRGFKATLKQQRKQQQPHKVVTWNGAYVSVASLKIAPCYRSSVQSLLCVVGEESIMPTSELKVAQRYSGETLGWALANNVDTTCTGEGSRCDYPKKPLHNCVKWKEFGKKRHTHLAPCPDELLCFVLLLKLVKLFLNLVRAQRTPN